MKFVSLFVAVIALTLTGCSHQITVKKGECYTYVDATEDSPTKGHTIALAVIEQGDLQTPKGPVKAVVIVGMDSDTKTFLGQAITTQESLEKHLNQSHGKKVACDSLG